MLGMHRSPHGLCLAVAVSVGALQRLVRALGENRGEKFDSKALNRFLGAGDAVGGLLCLPSVECRSLRHSSLLYNAGCIYSASTV